MRFGYVFLSVEPSRFVIERWLQHTLQHCRLIGADVRYIGGSKGRLIKAPRSQDALTTRILSASTPTVVAGKSHLGYAPNDSWRFCSSADVTNGREVFFCECFPNDVTVDDLAEWAHLAVEQGVGVTSVEYGYAYRGDRPDDIWFGLGISSAGSSSAIRSLGTEEAIARWSRAAIWGTNTGYLRDVFDVNFLRVSRMNKQGGSAKKVAIALQDIGQSVLVGDELHSWRLPDAASRENARAILASEGLLVADHEMGEGSQVQPT